MTKIKAKDRDHFGIDLTPTQIKNLTTLAAFLYKTVPPPDFNMGISFISGAELEYDTIITPHNALAVYYTCGTVACACGYGPLAGIKPRKKEDWLDYTKRVFTGDSIHLFRWLFSGDWVVSDNTPKGAAARILYTLANGFPVDCLGMIDGDISLPYTVAP